MNNLWHGSLVVVVASFLGAGVATSGVFLLVYFLPDNSNGNVPPAYCNVVRVPVYGEVVTIRPGTSEPAISEDDATTPRIVDTTYTVSTEIEETLRSAKGDESIKALLIDVDSYGGSPVGAIEIATAIRRFGRPTAAVIHGVGASAGYLIATAADTIFASEESNVGSIGVTGSYTDQSEKNRKEGITFHQLSSGPYKDTYSPDKPLTEAERGLIMSHIQTSHDNFVRIVAGYRQLSIEKVATLADGSTLMGRVALEAGLIDQLGGTEEALQYLEQAIGESATVCK
ncbi:MAG: signal peptide peptidase SppA [bacterium]|nr:signal peptide peptidase SppA [bacterium]